MPLGYRRGGCRTCHSFIVIPGRGLRGGLDGNQQRELPGPPTPTPTCSPPHCLLVRGRLLERAFIYSLAFLVIDGPHPKAFMHNLASKPSTTAC